VRVDLSPADPDDEPVLWAMLYEASFAADDGHDGPDDLRAVPELAHYVAGWGRPGDLGVVARAGPDGDVPAGTPLGAAWLRLLTSDERGGPGYGWVDDATPELAIGVAPGVRAGGLGTALLGRLLADAAGRYPAVSLSVRRANPARRLYQRFGFVVVAADRLAEAGSDPPTSVTMVRRLDGNHASAG
jgi:ribosomal protein S18 acetylase RimI-like enzyme